MPHEPRYANGSARRNLRARLRAEGRPCWICQLADELVPVSKYQMGGYQSPQAAALDYRNLAAAHKCCNEWRGNKTVNEVVAIIRGRAKGRRPPIAEKVNTSRDWRHGTRREVGDA